MKREANAKVRKNNGTGNVNGRNSNEDNNQRYWKAYGRKINGKETQSEGNANMRESKRKR